MGLLLDSTSFWDVVIWMIVFFFWVMAIWVFISIFGDIFRRRDLNGWGKAGWIFLLFILPFLGALIYLITRPKPSEEELRRMKTMYPHGGGPVMNTDDIAQAHLLLQQGALTQAEYDEIKARALGKA
jgi:hypothetical protein